ncbi:chloride channel protein [Subtercola vilae]|uniref:chloride channel protein n=1 Tax=Subtercola vilae TaxID=2056433 RepID=UPI0013C29F43|nr:chloride channel protein [Subtercola vilae]
MDANRRGRAAPAWLIRLAVVTVLVGVGGGVAGLLVSMSLTAIEHVAYGYSQGSFLDGVLGADPWRRVAALAVAGLVGGAGWWALRRFGRAVVSVEASVAGGRMPGLPTLLNAALQIVVVGLGASIGREVAPRELGALVAGWLSDRAHISARERRILVACGAGAGLAAVYNVPLSGAIFTIEVLLAEISFAVAVPALITAAVATIVARLVVPDAPLYSLPPMQLSETLFVWSLLAGPLMGLAAMGFVWLVRGAARLRPRTWLIVCIMPVVFAGVGLLAIPFPAVLGNGKALGEVAFAGAASIGLLAVLAVTKVVATTATIGAGAAGGTLTPSLAVGAALGGALGGLWSLWWPGSPIAGFAFVAVAAFLASSMRAPFTALVLLIEFTGQGPALLVPAMLAIAGSIAVSRLVSRSPLVARRNLPAP